MTAPYFLAIKGTFVITGYEPDGDSVRFIADNLDHYKLLHRSYRIKPSKRDGSVQLRFDGIDATELHYGSGQQPFGAEARDVLLKMMGFGDITYTADGSTKVASASPDSIPGMILSKMGEANGRPVALLLLEDKAQAHKLRDGVWTLVDDKVLKDTINVAMLANGMAYNTFYTSAPVAHIAYMRSVSAEARDKKLGVWAKDVTSEFELTRIEDLEPPDGQTILPKLFRRSVDYFKAVAKGFDGNLADWIISVSNTASRNENDMVVINGATPVPLSTLLEQRNKYVSFNADLLDIVFVEK